MSPFQFILLLLSVLANAVVLFAIVGLGTCSALFGIKPTYRRHLAQHLSVVLIFVVLGLLSVQCYVYQVVCNPTSQGHTICYNLSLVLTVWCFLRTALTNPGNPEAAEWQEWTIEDTVAHTEAPEVEKPAVNDEVREECILGGNPWFDGGSAFEKTFTRKRQSKGWAPGQVTKCGNCELRRPERAHHCWRCDTCVLRMDHHCSLVGNCIGWRNHKYFVLLQFYQFCTCMLFLSAAGGPGAEAWEGKLDLDGYWRFFLIDMAVVWTMGLGLITGKTFITTLHGVLANQTCVESHYEGKNPYRSNQGVDNIRDIFGASSWVFFLPFEPVGRPSKGTSFSMRTSSPSFVEGSRSDSKYGTVDSGKAQN